MGVFICNIFVHGVFVFSVFVNSVFVRNIFVNNVFVNNVTLLKIKSSFLSPPPPQLCTARGGWQSVSPGYRPYKKNSTKINVNLFDILELDEKEMSLKVEPMVNMGQITHFLGEPTVTTLERSTITKPLLTHSLPPFSLKTQFLRT